MSLGTRSRVACSRRDQEVRVLLSYVVWPGRGRGVGGRVARADGAGRGVPWAGSATGRPAVAPGGGSGS